MPQAQEPIPLLFEDGTEGRAVATGNNAAWMCRCGRKLPLLGRSGTSEGVRVDCPDCPRSYFVVPKAGALTSAIKVRQVPRP